jgi:N,N-dimethylformamidase
MNSPSRRAFIRGSILAGTALASGPLAFGVGRRRATTRGFLPAIPSHQPLEVPGVHVYADRESALPGETVAFQVSTDTPVRARLCRLGTAVDDPATDEVLHDFGTLPARVQPIHPGSYVHVERRLAGEWRAFTVEAWVRPWRVDRLMGVVSQEDKESSEGWALGLGKEGYVGCYLGDGVSADEALVHRTPPHAVTRGRWHHLVGRWDGRRKEVWVDGRLVAAWDFAGPLKPGPHPIRLGAMSEKGETTRFLDGDLAMVALYERALHPEEIGRRFGERGLVTPRSEGLTAAWSFAEERGDRVADLSGRARHGRIVNHGTWMIGGPAFEPAVARFGDYDPARDSRRGHGLRLASDDLYDCRWETTCAWRVPPDARSGFHVLRLSWEREGREFLGHAPFVVRRSSRRRPAPVLLLAATNTWRAYNAAPFGQPQPGARQVCGTDGFPNAPGQPPAFSFYRGHVAGPGTYQVGSRLPWPSAGPYLRYGDATDYSHLARAERFAQTWLEREGYEYEVITDRDLHRDPGRLRRHRVLVINGHSEYWSVEMYRGLEEYLGAGGKLVVLSGNSLFWRVTYSPDGSILECRKVDAPGDQVRPELRGEAWHSHDARRGGLLRECGFPGWKLIGLETLGWNNHGDPRNYGPWIADTLDHPVFHSPEETGLHAGDRFGWAGEGQVPMANGHEFDVRLSTLAALASEPVPPGAVLPADPAGLVRLANGVIPWRYGGSAFDYFFRPIKPATDQGGEMIWWERPGGGTVFNAGSIGAGWALHADPRWATLLRNVLHRFGVPRPTRAA